LNTLIVVASGLDPFQNGFFSFLLIHSIYFSAKKVSRKNSRKDRKGGQINPVPFKLSPRGSYASADGLQA
jgi:hypothetical protein